MEIEGKHSSGFTKGKLMPLVRAVRPSSKVQYSSNKVIGYYKSSQSSPPPAAVGYLVQPDHVTGPKLSYMDNSVREKMRSHLADKLFGIAVDESVDTKAACYISSVRERFKHEVF